MQLARALSSSPRVCGSQTNDETVRARLSASILSGASAVACQVAIVPITLSTGVPAFFALCKLARPFERPGPR
eukprot:2683805-Prymnesium_polylepis.1